LDCFLRALPFTYRNVPAKPGATVRITVSGECGGTWYLHRAESAWQLAVEAQGEQVAETTIPQEIAWRIFTKGIALESAQSHAKITGDIALGLPVLGMVSIVST
jgi:hypothetical protein